MKKIRRVLAMIGVIIILALYIITIILALFGNKNTLPLLKISFTATIIVPVLIWVYTLVYKLLENR